MFAFASERAQKQLDFGFNRARLEGKCIDLQSRSNIMAAANSDWPLFINVPNSIPH